MSIVNGTHLAHRSIGWRCAIFPIPDGIGAGVELCLRSFQWPTLVTLVIFPILMFMYVRLARREERDAIAEFSEEYLRYASKTPAFFPHFSSSATEKATTKKPDEHFGDGHTIKKYARLRIC